MSDRGELDDAGRSVPLTPERWLAVDAVLQGALGRTPPERATYLAEVCAGDPALRREVDSLLARVTADDFLERPAAGDTTAADAVAHAIGVAYAEAGRAMDSEPDRVESSSEWRTSSSTARLSAALAGRYALERELGRGGMATVYLARDLRHRRPVALKVLEPHLGAFLGLSRFVREIETAAGLSHPHILPLHDSGTADGLFYYVMPYVTGGSLRERLRGGQRLAVSEAMRVVREVAAALDYAHRHGVVHRDIKPENILLGEDGDALVADFGIACALEDATSSAAAGVGVSAGTAVPDSGPDTLTRWGAVVGTPAYMSPEQALGTREVDGRSDQYALGCVAFELLAGTRPFTGSTAEQLAQRPTQEPPSLAARRPDLPPAADAILGRALATVLEARFATASAFAHALAQALVVPHGEAPHEVATGGVARGAHASTARRRLGRGAGALAAIALTVVGGTVLYRARATDASDRRLTQGTRPVTGGEAPVDPEAFELYLKGTRVRYGRSTETSPADYFARAIAKDSTYAPAYAGLAFENTFNGDGARARSLAEKALALDPTLAEGHMVLGMIRQFLDWDWEGAEGAFRDAIGLKRNYPEAHLELSMLLMRRGRFDEALREAQNAVYLAPMSARFEVGIGEVYLYSGRYDEALSAARRALAVDSSNVGAYVLRAYAYGEQQRYAAAVEAATKCIALGCDVTGRAILGYLYARSGRRVAALQIVDTLQARWREEKGRRAGPNIAIGIAQVFVGLRDPDRALDWLERGGTSEMYVSYLGIDPTFRPLHAEPRFRELLRRVGLDG